MPDNLPDIIIDENLRKIVGDHEKLRAYEVNKLFWIYIKKNGLMVKRKETQT